MGEGKDERKSSEEFKGGQESLNAEQVNIANRRHGEAPKGRR